MLAAEAKWLGQRLERIEGQALSPLLNVGSATAEFRERTQPWIEERIFAPLRRRGVQVHHLDMQDGPGIDLRGDLADPAFIARLAGSGYRSLLCCNLLEHVADRAGVCASIERMLPAGGYILVTVPHRFPYHPDPIDTMFRPTVDELGSLFPHCRPVEGEILDCGTGWDYVGRNPFVLIAKVGRRLLGRERRGGVKGSASFLPWMFRRFRQSCLMLQKAGPTDEGDRAMGEPGASAAR
jgi:hypothetical protein